MLRIALARSDSEINGDLELRTRTETRRADDDI
jgi:hypothetical protein